MSFNIITRSKCYSLFPILSGLVEPSLCNFRIPLANGLFSPITAILLKACGKNGFRSSARK
ncbi:hypothetical protein HanPSC8_Chr00c451g0808591 [Helianthus annuus]|nr:hypothetical protein HanPSC8_Chr00c451g0808591 [Helianthus annuus]